MQPQNCQKTKYKPIRRITKNDEIIFDYLWRPRNCDPPGLQAKRKGGPGAGTTTGRLGAAAGEDKEQGAAKHLFGDFDFDYSDSKVAALARGLVQYAPTFDTEMQKYTEAEVGAEVE